MAVLVWPPFGGVPFVWDPAILRAACNCEAVRGTPRRRRLVMKAFTGLLAMISLSGHGFRAVLASLALTGSPAWGSRAVAKDTFGRTVSILGLLVEEAKGCDREVGTA